MVEVKMTSPAKICRKHKVLFHLNNRGNVIYCGVKGYALRFFILMERATGPNTPAVDLSVNVWLFTANQIDNNLNTQL